ncbi:MAG: hypothetical protein ACR2HO_12750 [Rubrobacteraceae bacterium]|nr:hypothetical protein [Rubrobacter sp.]
MPSNKNGVKKQKWYEAFTLSVQMFHGPGKGLGRGRGPRLAEPPKPKEEEGNLEEVFR